MVENYTRKPQFLTAGGLRQSGSTLWTLFAAHSCAYSRRHANARRLLVVWPVIRAVSRIAKQRRWVGRDLDRCGNRLAGDVARFWRSGRRC